MKDTLSRKVPIPQNARRDVYYDTQELVQDQATVNFYPASASREVPRNNYISNPFPGEDSRLIYGLSFELNKQYIETDPANDIDGPAIINALKDAGLKITADQSHTEFLRTLIGDHFNFDGTHVDLDLTVAGDPAGTTQETAESEVVTIQSTAFTPVPDPFLIASNQVVQLSVTFADASPFPKSSDWESAGKDKLFLKAKMHLAELTPQMVKRYRNKTGRKAS